jgi:hypothetical protein
MYYMLRKKNREKPQVMGVPSARKAVTGEYRDHKPVGSDRDL